MRVWLIEDDGFKRERVRAAVHDIVPNADICEARSAKSAFNLLSRGNPELVILDMSLPTFDIGPGESGGRPQGFGGIEVLREMDRREVLAPVVIVTQYEVFGEERLGIAELAKKLRAEHGDRFVDLVYYDAASGQWREAFENALRRILETCEGK